MANVEHSAVKSERFCAPDADITFQSCDHVMFRVHRKNLEINSEGFSAPSGTTSSDSIVPLSECAEVLELLFQYVYPQRTPDLTSIRFKTLADLAEAAEKYQVFGAMEICMLRMRDVYKDHPFEVLLHATRHGYPELMDIAQARALEIPPVQAFELFSPAVYIAFTRYHAQWMEIVSLASQSIQDSPLCSGHVNGIPPFYKRLISSPASLLDLDALFSDFPDGSCYNFACNGANKAAAVRRVLEAKIMGVKSLGSFL